MGSASVHISEHIDRPSVEVYRVASDPARLPEWAAGLGGSVERVDGRWVLDSPGGRVVVEFAPPNAYGVLDHTVVLPTGETVCNPMRVIPDGDGCEVVFTLRRQPSMTDDELARDAAAVAADLATLKTLMESAPAGAG